MVAKALQVVVVEFRGGFPPEEKPSRVLKTEYDYK